MADIQQRWKKDIWSSSILAKTRLSVVLCSGPQQNRPPAHRGIRFISYQLLFFKTVTFLLTSTIQPHSRFQNVRRANKSITF